MPALFSTTEWNTHLEIAFLDASSANAFGLPAAREFSALIKRYKKWTKPVVVRSAHARVFCSGGQLSDYARLKSKAAGLKINREITNVLDSFGRWPVVKLAVVEGDVFGGGMEWLARFDYRWSAPSAVFAFWQRKIALSTGWGGGEWWAKRVGEDRVRQLLLEARLLSAGEALRLRLVDRVLTRWSLKEEVEAWARAMSMAGDENVRSSKTAPAYIKLTQWSSRRENKLFADLWMGPEHRAVLEKWKNKKK
ncbi:MAG: enoyl-CoA hydratase/isomerase family protein [Bdellovibrionales bacterium]|nr:enoyl-CoA hydratase/isomerase family protein [Bdellovibrionales bacterium]